MSMSECSAGIGNYSVKQAVVKFAKCSKTESLILPGKSKSRYSTRVHEKTLKCTRDYVEEETVSNIVGDSREGGNGIYAVGQDAYMKVENIVDNGLA